MNKYKKIGSLIGFTLLGTTAVAVPVISTSCKNETHSIDLVDLLIGDSLENAKLQFDKTFRFPLPIYDNSFQIVDKDDYETGTYTSLAIVSRDDDNWEFISIVSFSNERQDNEFKFYDSELGGWKNYSYSFTKNEYKPIKNIGFYANTGGFVEKLPTDLRGLCKVTWNS